MTIGIDIRFLAKGTRTGIEEYALNLLSRLLSADRSVKFKLFYNAFNKAPLDFPWVSLSNVELKKFSLPNRFIFDPLAKFCRRPRLDKLLGGADVFFCPHFLLSPVSGRVKKIVTFHDLSFEYFPEFFPWHKRFWHKTQNPSARAGEADKIIAVSRSTKNDLIEFYGVPEEKIKVIYSGVGEEFKKADLSLEKKKFIRNKYCLPEEFILYFGTLEPRKNLIGLIKAYEIFRRRIIGKNPPSLVIAGQPGWLYGDILTTAKKSPFTKDIIFTGFIEPADKACLYNLASFFVYPSFFEGFGFPPLEAMACGVPVVCSHTSSFPETAGEAAILVDPYNFGEIAWAMAEVWQDKNLRDYLVEQGYRQAKKFSWDKCAKETLEFLIS
ncbi:MAG: glycosyltransferase family 1 protein [Candidatus Portnoybacteria bacterium]|nr:glycosyltransferase family 1 protein [Candidatus Portnoybacteria bacterium]